MKKIYLLVLFICVLLFAREIRSAQIESVGICDIKDSGSLDDRKQEAFVVAFFSALNKIGEEFGVDIKDIITIDKERENITRSDIWISSNWEIDGFRGKSQMMMSNTDVKLDLINVHYENESIIIKDHSLIFPAVDLLEFPNWRKIPKKIANIEIKEIGWYSSDRGYDYCQVTLSYSYDPSNVTKKEEKGELKSLSFKFIKDQTGNYVYKKVTIDGTAYGGGNDPPDVMRQKALEQALRNAAENVNGVFIKSVTEIKNAVVTKDEVLSHTLGIAQVVDKKFIPLFTSEGNYQVTCSVTANVPIMELVPQ